MKSVGFWRALVSPWTWRMAWRDSRRERGRLLLFSLSLVAGVGAMAAIHALSGDAERAVGSQEKSLLGSDAKIGSRRPFTQEELTALRAFGDDSASEVSFGSMLRFVRNGEEHAARMVQVRGFEGDYPFYGNVESEPADAWNQVRNGGAILVEPALLDQFGVAVGDTVRLGEAELTIAGTIKTPLPRAGRFSGFAPEVYLAFADVESSGLAKRMTLAWHHLHLRTDSATDETGLADALKAAFPDSGWQIETPADRRETLAGAVENFRFFLGVLSAAAMVLGAAGVASAMRAHLARRLKSVAVLRCLGASGGQAAAVYFAQASALGAAGAVLGCLVGGILHSGTVALVLARTGIDWPQQVPVRALLEAGLVGWGVCMAFALLPLSSVWSAPPQLVLRGETASPSRWGRLTQAMIALFLAAVMAGFGWFSTGSLMRGLVMAGALTAVFLILWSAARVLMWLAKRITRAGWKYELRQGVANLHRPGNQTALFVISLGLGVFLLVTVLGARQLIERRASVAQSPNSPDLYLVDVQPDQIDGVAELLKDEGLPLLDAAPMITMRIASVRGRTRAELLESGDAPSWVLNREYRSSWKADLNDTETLVAGAWHPATVAGEPVPVSLVKELAEDLGIGIGDPFVMDVQGVTVACVVGSLREVDWSQFNLNFFMVFPPDSLEGAPAFYVLTTRLEGKSSGNLQRRVATRYPNVSAIDLALILENVRTLVGRILTVAGILSAFSLAAGALILAGVMWNGREARREEASLLRMLGASKQQLGRIFASEYTAMGVIAGFAGLLPALGVHFLMAIRVFKTDPTIPVILYATAFLLTVLASLIAGRTMGGGKILRR